MNWRSAACTSLIAEQQLQQALEAVDQHLAGKRPKVPKGMEFYPPVSDAG